MAWTDILQCPTTGERLLLDDAASIVRCEHSDVTYAIVDGIVDFCPDSHDRMSASYDRVASRYDPYITGSSVFAKVLDRIIRGADGRDVMNGVLSFLPDSFSGVLLDVPVGTGVFTAPLYSRYRDATIVGIDCSVNMLQQARSRFREQGVTNVHFLKANAAHLPVRAGTADMVVSMNGWHAFAEKRQTIAEMRRVLHRQGKLIACGYVRGERRRCDWFVRHLGVRNGFFTPPFFAADELAEQFKGLKIVRQEGENSLAWFEAVKGGEDARARP